MANYPSPNENVPIFNNSNYLSNSVGLTQTQANLLYAQLSGSVVRGFTTFNAGISTPSISNGGFAFSMPSSAGQLALVSQIPSTANFVDLTTTQTIGGLKSFSNYLRITNQFGLNQTNISGCTIYSNSFTGGLGGFQFDTTAQSTGFSIFKLPAIASSATYITPSNNCSLLGTVGSYILQNSQGISLSNNQTITVASYLAGCSFNSSATTITDSATAASGVVANVSDFQIGQKAFAATNTGVFYTNACSLRITGPPINSTNVSFGTANSLLIDSGNITLNLGRYLSAGYGNVATPIFSISGNGGLFSPAINQMALAVSGSTIISCTTTYAQIFGIKIGNIGSTTVNEVRGTITYSTALAAGAFVSIGYVNFTNGITFASIPNVIVSMTNNPGGNYWDQCQVAISQLSTTQLNVAIRNNSTNITNGTATINYIAWI